ncbi:hypothetical protein PoB_000420100 [Plakobranchus ocellatus]|uniref:Uncharacterized protein n=1 Tax=Plakobranchus ocellatus TaxID=259542 RepID=A0AAV3Y5J5_9GAST|nr:hypothetical protein PoB_000420100 [Plakobranchus ocellatus]
MPVYARSTRNKQASADWSNGKVNKGDDLGKQVWRHFPMTSYWKLLTCKQRRPMWSKQREGYRNRPRYDIYMSSILEDFSTAKCHNISSPIEHFRALFFNKDSTSAPFQYEYNTLIARPSTPLESGEVMKME